MYEHDSDYDSVYDHVRVQVRVRVHDHVHEKWDVQYIRFMNQRRSFRVEGV